MPTNETPRFPSYIGYWLLWIALGLAGWLISIPLIWSGHSIAGIIVILAAIALYFRQSFEAAMILKPANLVRHKSGGPIMMIDDLISRDQLKGVWGIDDGPRNCTWHEDGIKKIGSFRPSELQSVYADGHAQKPRRRSVVELPLLAHSGHGAGRGL